MKILAYCLQNKTGHFGHLSEVDKWLPAIPAGLVTTEGFVWRNERLVDGDFRTQDLPVPLEVPDEHWLGIEADGSCIVLAPSEQSDWRISRATRTLEEVQSLARSSSDRAAGPIREVYALHAAAALIGIRIYGLYSALVEARKTHNEPLEVTVRTLIEELLH